LRVDIRIISLSGERLWDYDKPLPAKANLSININVMEATRTASGLEAPFMFTINYSPPIAHISIKGKAMVTGTEEEVEAVMEEQKRSRRPPPQVIQAVSTACITEAIIISRSLNIPPPIPPIGPPPTPSGRREEPGPTTSYTR